MRLSFFCWEDNVFKADSFSVPACNQPARHQIFVSCVKKLQENSDKSDRREQQVQKQEQVALKVRDATLKQQVQELREQVSALVCALSEIDNFRPPSLQRFDGSTGSQQSVLQSTLCNTVAQVTEEAT